MRPSLIEQTSQKLTVILGINAYHGDASAALVVDGQLKAAAEEELGSFGLKPVTAE